MLSLGRHKSLQSLTVGAALTATALAQSKDQERSRINQADGILESRPTAPHHVHDLSRTPSPLIFAELKKPLTPTADSRRSEVRDQASDLPPSPKARELDAQPSSAPDQAPRSISSPLLGIGSLVSAAAGYLIVALRSVPPDKRDQHVATRAGAWLDFKEGFYPFNPSALRIMRTNNLALTLTGAALALQGKQSLWGISFFALALCGATTVLPLTEKYGPQKPVNNFLKWCERCSVASISLFAVSLSPLGDRVAATLGVTPLLLGGASALVARGLSMIPTAFDIWKETKRPDASRGFPGLKALYIWTAGAAFSAAAVDFSLSAATMLPVGALIQNLALSTFATERFFQWKSKISKMT
jgi:hypothetical protein